MNQTIGIVTVLYNSETVLTDYFTSLNNQTYRDFILYVVDNKSPDSSLILAKTLSETASFRTVIIENEDNYGVAKGNNLGIQSALSDGCDMVLISNNDVTLESEAIELLLNGLEFHCANMAVPKIYYSGSDLIWAAGGYFRKMTGLNTHFGDKMKDVGQFQVAKKVTYAATCFMLIRKEVFERVGMMDENYFVYFDDTDFMYRALNKNEPLWYIPESIVYHKESTSTGIMSEFSIRYLYRNLVYFALKNYSLTYALYVLILDFGYNFFVNIFKWPFSKWKLRLKSYKEGFKLYKQTYCD